MKNGGDMMGLSRNQKILVIIGLVAAILYINYTPPQEAIAVLDTTFIVKNQSGIGVVGAKINCYQHGLFGDIPTLPSFTLYTESGGMVWRRIAQGIYTVEIIAPGYNILTNVLDLRVSGEVNPSRIFTFTLITGSGGNPPPNTYPVDFYLVGPNNVRVSAYVSSEGSTELSDAHGRAQLHLIAGTHTVTFSGYYTQTAGNFIDFDFDVGVIISGATIYTVYVHTASVQVGNPPSENNGGNWWDLIIANPMVLALFVVAFVLLLRR
jgi:hypothetical protein